MKSFFKGIIVGLGAVAPGVSGSVLLVLFGLYKKTINSISTLFKDFKKNLNYLGPLFLGILIGAILFSKIINYFLINYEKHTRFTFFGLILGTIPIFYKEVKKEGFSNNYYYIIITLSLIIGIVLFNSNLFKTINNPNFFQSIILGFTVAGSSIVPGIDSAAILSSFGLYELYVESLAIINLDVLIPAFIGLIIGIFVISIGMNNLINNHYTLTFSIIFGLFLAVLPKVLNNISLVILNYETLICLILTTIGFITSYYFSKIK